MVVEDRLVRVEAIMEEMRSTMTSIDHRIARVEDRMWWLAGMIFTAWVSTFLAVIVTGA